MKIIYCSILSLAALFSLGWVAYAIADAPRDAGSKMRGEDYNFWVGERAQSHAQDNVRSLHYYGQTQEVVPAPQAQEHVTAVRQNLATVEKSVVVLKKANPDNKDVQAAIANIAELHKKVLMQCDNLDKELAKDTAEGVKIRSTCVKMHADLDKANAEMKALMKALKIEAPQPLPPLEPAAPAPAPAAAK